MATTRMAAGSMLATVTNTANMVSSVVNVAADSVNMLGSYVAKHRYMQDKSNALELDSFELKLLKRTARENQIENEEITSWLNEKPGRQAQYEAEFNRLSKILNPVSETDTGNN